jgi:hypothetical protein
MNTELCEVADNRHIRLGSAIRVRVEPAADGTRRASRESIPAFLDFRPMVLTCKASPKQEQRWRSRRTVSFGTRRATWA